ncbi:tyrosine-type recombinase/integrase [Dongia sp.]|uniref:tyrosine-type recombinase/integrase n=1 Tax=Dongia sp. TaxID=1977262 RepID=UPI0034A4B95D
MVLRMTRPTKRPESSFLTFRKRVPADILAKARGQSVTIHFPPSAADNATTVTVKLGEVVKFSLRTRDPVVAKSRTGVAEARLQSVWESIRSGPKRLTHKQIVALAGQLYEAFAKSVEDDPGSASVWQKVIADNDAAQKGAFANGLKIFTDDQERQADSLAKRFGPLVDVVLQREGLVIDDMSRLLLLRQGGFALSDAAKKLKKNAEGDYSPDPTAARFPIWEGVEQPKATAATTITSLFDGWKKEAVKRNLSQSTFDEYTSRIGMFLKWLGHDDALKVEPSTVVAYKEHRLELVSAKTVKDCDLVTLKAIFGWAKENHKLPSNPAEGIRVRVAKKTKVRERSFTEPELKVILKTAQSYVQTAKMEHPKMAAAKRWLPWLCAYSGARIGEVAQLRRKDFDQSEGVWFYTITPEAGDVKTKEARRVPVHEHLVTEGLIRYVEGVADGYLFMNAKTREDAIKRLGPVKNRVRELVRTVVTDPNVAPNHGWRHTFKSRAMGADMRDRLVDIITGHAAKTEGDKYRNANDKTLASGMSKFPRYELKSE